MKQPSSFKKEAEIRGDPLDCKARKQLKEGNHRAADPPARDPFKSEELVQSNDAPEDNSVAVFASLVAQELLREIGCWPPAEELAGVQPFFRNAPSCVLGAALIQPIKAYADG